MAKKSDKPKVTIGYKCERCGKIFARTHPKDTEIYCEKCRRKYDTVHDKDKRS